jgi:hypothetical protein
MIVRLFQDYVSYYLNVRENIGVGRVNDIDSLELVNRAAQKSGADVIVKNLLMVTKPCSVAF